MHNPTNPDQSSDPRPSAMLALITTAILTYICIVAFSAFVTVNLLAYFTGLTLPLGRLYSSDEAVQNFSAPTTSKPRRLRQFPQKPPRTMTKTKRSPPSKPPFAKSIRTPRRLDKRNPSRPLHQWLDQQLPPATEQPPAKPSHLISVRQELFTSGHLLPITLLLC